MTLERDSRPQGEQPSVFSLGLLVVVVFILQTGLRACNDWLAPSGNLLKLWVIFHQLGVILLPVIVFLLILGVPLRPALGLGAPSWKRFAAAVPLGFVAIFAVLTLLPRILSPSEELQQAGSSIVAHTNLPEFLLAFVAVVVAASVADELFFRGLLLHGLSRRYGILAAILATALLTAVFHTLEPFKLVHSFLMAAIFAGAVAWTRSTWTSILLHGLHNFLGLIQGG